MSNIKFAVREGRKTDCKEIRRLIQELADFEKMPEGPKITVEILEKDGFDTNPPLYGCFVAECTDGAQEGDNKVVAYALYYYAYSSWNGKKMFLEDVFVSEKYRRQHIGARLFQKVAEKAVAENCVYLEFNVLAWNPAKVFYKARGAVNMTEAEEWNMYRLTGEELRKAASS